MKPRKRILLLVLIMSLVVMAVTSVGIYILYETAFNEEQLRLVETVKSQARLIEAIARFDKIYSGNYPYGPRQATLNQIREAHSNYRGFGETGEFTLATRQGDQIVFLLRHRHFDHSNLKPVPWKSRLAEPSHLALSGKSGTLIGLDYRGERVLAAYEYVADLNLGIVAKIDLAEIRAPFIKAGLLSAMSALIFIAFGAGIFIKITNPIIDNLQDTISKLRKALREVKTLRGILPICSFCKKIRNDEGYWAQVEVYIHQRTDVDFSHGVCPECLAKHYPNFKPPEEPEENEP